MHSRQRKRREYIKFLEIHDLLGTSLLIFLLSLSKLYHKHIKILFIIPANQQNSEFELLKCWEYLMVIFDKLNL